MVSHLCSQEQKTSFASHFDQSNALEDVGLKMCMPRTPRLHLAERCNPWNPSLGVALAVTEACQ
ncbi:hypothetical protein TNCT_472091, partial [Trichonephila clavata]